MCNQLRILFKSRGEVPPKREQLDLHKRWESHVRYATHKTNPAGDLSVRHRSDQTTVVAAWLSITIMEMCTTIKLTNYA